MTTIRPVLVSLPDSSELLPTPIVDGVMGRIAARDTAAIEECLIRYGDLVWSIARRFSATYADAEEAVQEIFVEVWRSAEHYDEKISSEAVYMTMIARRTLIDRKCRCDQELQASLRNDREAPQPQTTVGNVLEHPTVNCIDTPHA